MKHLKKLKSDFRKPYNENTVYNPQPLFISPIPRKIYHFSNKLILSIILNLPKPILFHTFIYSYCNLFSQASKLGKPDLVFLTIIINKAVIGEGVVNWLLLCASYTEEGDMLGNS